MPTTLAKNAAPRSAREAPPKVRRFIMPEEYLLLHALRRWNGLVRRRQFQPRRCRSRWLRLPLPNERGDLRAEDIRAGGRAREDEKQEQDDRGNLAKHRRRRRRNQVELPRCGFQKTPGDRLCPLQVTTPERAIRKHVDQARIAPRELVQPGEGRGLEFQPRTRSGHLQAMRDVAGNFVLRQRPAAGTSCVAVDRPTDGRPRQGTEQRRLADE